MESLQFGRSSTIHRQRRREGDLKKRPRRRRGRGVVSRSLRSINTILLSAAVPRRAVPCYAMPCHAMPYRAVPCHATPRYTTLCYAAPKSGRRVRESGRCARCQGHAALTGPASRVCLALARPRRAYLAGCLGRAETLNRRRSQPLHSSPPSERALSSLSSAFRSRRKARSLSSWRASLLGTWLNAVGHWVPARDDVCHVVCFLSDATSIDVFAKVHTDGPCASKFVRPRRGYTCCQQRAN